MNVINKARELGVAIQQDERYIQYHEAKEKNDNDKELQDLIGKFNLKRLELNTEMSKPEKDNEKLSVLDAEIKVAYNDIMENENMINFTNAKNAMDELLTQVNLIITQSANGEDPMTCAYEKQASCGGSCSSCSGCH